MADSTYTQRKEDFFISPSPEEAHHISNQNIEIDVSQPPNKVLAQCHNYLYGQDNYEYKSISELMQEIEELVSFLKQAYRRAGKLNSFKPYIMGQSMKIPFYMALLRETALFYRVSPRRYLLRFLQDYGEESVVQEHIDSADPLDKESLNQYLTIFMGIADKNKKGSGKCHAPSLRKVFRRLMTDHAEISREDILKAAYALDMNADQAANFAARALRIGILPLTTHEGLIHRFCLDAGGSFADAEALLSDYRTWYAETCPRTVFVREEGHTQRFKNSYEKFVRTLTKDNPQKNLDNFKRFLREEASYLDVGSRSALSLYRVLAVYLLVLKKNAIEIPKTAQKLQDNLIYLLSFLNPAVENAPKEKIPDDMHVFLLQYRKYKAWSYGNCESVYNAILEIDPQKSDNDDAEKSWYYLRCNAAGKLQKVTLSNRVFANLLADYKEYVLTKEIPLCEQQILKEDLLILLYQIFRITQEKTQTTEESTEFADAFWYVADYYLKKINCDFDTGMEFYMPNDLEFSLMLSVAGNIDLDEMTEDLFTSDKERQKERYASRPVSEPKSSKLFTDKLKNLRQKYSNAYTADLSGLEPVIHALDTYFAGKTYRCCAYFNQEGIWPSYPTGKDIFTTDGPLLAWDANVPDVLIKDTLYKRPCTAFSPPAKYQENAAGSHGQFRDKAITIGDLAEKIVQEAANHSGNDAYDKEKKELETAILLFFILLLKEIQKNHPDLKLEFQGNAVASRKITLTGSTNFSK